jgi:hypothetical protein
MAEVRPLARKLAQVVAGQRRRLPFASAKWSAPSTWATENTTTPSESKHVLPLYLNRVPFNTGSR